MNYHENRKESLINRKELIYSRKVPPSLLIARKLQEAVSAFISRSPVPWRPPFRVILAESYKLDIQRLCKAQYHYQCPSPTLAWSQAHMMGCLTTDDTATPNNVRMPRALRAPNRELRLFYEALLAERM